MGITSFLCYFCMLFLFKIKYVGFGKSVWILGSFSIIESDMLISLSSKLLTKLLISIVIQTWKYIPNKIMKSINDICIFL